MFLHSSTYKVGNKKINNRIMIEDLNRDLYLANGLGKHLQSWFNELTVGDNVAVIFAAGPAIHHSDMRDTNKLARHAPVVIKSQIGFSVFEILRLIPFNPSYVSSNCNTCASSLHAIYEAEILLNKGYSDVIIYSLDVVDETQELLFKQLGIDLVCGDGLVGLHFKNEPTEIMISNTTWIWNRDTSPMSVSSEGYLKVLNNLELVNIDVVKTHGSGTDRNTVEEHKAIFKVLPNVKLLEYKQDIGHTQGASTGIETCMMLENTVWNKGIVLASGLGGFYGGFNISRY